MASEAENPVNVSIGRFNFADRSALPDETGSSTLTSPSLNTATGNLPAYERMAGDKVGEELAHDATIWKLYLEEAAEFDLELVDRHQKSLDLLLLFATLFSAILTAFLVVSNELLQPNPQDTSAELLLLIAKSQYRIERGLSPPESDPIPEMPSSTPSMQVRAVNGLWFTSLGLSLAAALIAMLAKEWLTAYLSSRPRPVHTHALDRQARFEGLERWWVLPIVAILPSMLHLSLLSFFIGLVVYLWKLDLVIASVLTAMVTATTLFYLLTTLLGAVYKHCPYVTVISRYVRALVLFVLRKSQPNQNISETAPSKEDLRALLWLAGNARDPDVIDCCYQALSGLGREPRADKSGDTRGPELNFPVNHVSEIPLQINKETDLISLLKTLIGRLERAQSDPLYLARMPSSSVRRYLNAITTITRYVMDLPRAQLQQAGFDSIETYHMEHDEKMTTLPETISPFNLLGILDSQWTNITRPLTPGFYVDWLVAEYDVMVLAKTYLDIRERVINDPPASPPTTTTASPVHFGVEGHIIGFVQTDPVSEAETEGQRPRLHAQCNRWLARVFALVHFHNNSTVSLSAASLQDLLGCVARVAQSDLLNQNNSVGHDHSENATDDFGAYNYVASLGRRDSFSVASAGLHGGTLDILLRLLKKHAPVGDTFALAVCPAALKTYAALGPVLLQSELGLEYQSLLEAFNPTHWPNERMNHARGLRYICMRLTLLIMRLVAQAQTSNPSHFRFLDAAMWVGYACLCADENKLYGAERALAEHSQEMNPLLELLSEDLLRMDQSRIKHLSQFCVERLIGWSRRTHPESDVNACHHALSPNSFPILIHLIQRAGTIKLMIRKMLGSMVDRMRARDNVPRDRRFRWNNTPSIEYLYPFTRSSLGFASIVSASIHPDCLDIVLQTIVDFTRLAAGHDPELVVDPVELQPSAVPSFLEVVSLMAKHCEGNPARRVGFVSFVEYAVVLLSAAATDDESRGLMRSHSAFNHVLKELGVLENKHQPERVARQVRELMAGLETPEQSGETIG